jgi:hypothetical protein
MKTLVVGAAGGISRKFAARLAQHGAAGGAGIARAASFADNVENRID